MAVDARGSILTVRIAAERLIAGAAPGAILLAHDIHPPTVDAMVQVFDALLERGYKFVTVSQLMAAGGIDMSVYGRPGSAGDFGAPRPILATGT